MSATFQLMPALTTEEFATLRADVAERGIVVPVVRDQHGRLLDGHHRERIAAELGIDCPTEVRHVADDNQARDVALALNLARRHLSREQRRELITREVEVRPEDSDRAIARRLGCSPSTVGAVRRGGVSNLDTDTPVMSREEARELTSRVRAELGHLDSLVDEALSLGARPGWLLAVYRRQVRELGAEYSVEARAVVQRPFEPLLDRLEELALADGGDS